MAKLNRRDFIATLGMGATLSMLGVVRGTPSAGNRGRVVVVGGGFGGATCAKYLRKLDRAAGASFRAAEARYTQGWYASITRDAFS